MPGKGSYFGGGTIISPKDRGWFGDPGKPDLVNKPKRRKRPAKAAPRPVVTGAHQAQIDKLRQVIQAAEREIARATKQRDADKADLNALLKSLGLPPDP